MGINFGYIKPGSIEEADDGLAIKFFDIDGYERTLPVNDMDSVDRVLGMIDDQIKYKVCALDHRIVEVEGIIVIDQDRPVANLKNGDRITLPEQFHAPADVQMHAKFKGAYSHAGYMEAFSSEIHLPEPEKVLGL